MSDDALLSEYDVESALSIAYVHAIAGHAGYTCGPPPGEDRDSIDIQVSAGGRMRPKIDIQLKACINFKKLQSGEFSYPLKAKNYNDLREVTQTPRILVVLDLPREREEWLLTSTDNLVIRKSAYWVSLRDKPEAQTESISVRIPSTNVFDVPTLKLLMEQSRSGRIIG